MNEIGKTYIASSIEEFIRSEYSISLDDSKFSSQVHLWEEGYLDSMGVVEVINFIETTFEVKIPESALFSEDFTNIDGMAGIVANLISTR